MLKRHLTSEPPTLIVAFMILTMFLIKAQTVELIFPRRDHFSGNFEPNITVPDDWPWLSAWWCLTSTGDCCHKHLFTSDSITYNSVMSLCIMIITWNPFHRQDLDIIPINNEPQPRKFLWHLFIFSYKTSIGRWPARQVRFDSVTLGVKVVNLLKIIYKFFLWLQFYYTII